MNSNKKVAAILLMGGSGDRFGSKTPKQFHRLSGKKLYQHTLEKFLRIGFHEIILVCPEGWLEKVENVKVIAGGKTRQESSYLGLLACSKDTEVVVIHDAVRPFVTERIISENIEAAYIHGAVDTCIPTADTIVHSKDGEVVTDIPKRHQYLRGQTPQSFRYPLILKAHEAALGVNASDDCSLVLNLGHSVHIVKGDEHNIKITTELDLYIAEQLFRLSPVHTTSSRASLKGKRYVITGGSGGIGSEVIKLLEKEEALCTSISRNASDFSTDLTSPEHVEAVFEKIGPIDGLINCVGLFKVKELKNLSSQEIKELIAVNLTSLIYCCKWAKVIEEGHIVNISSSSYSKGRKDYPIYSSAKAAVVNFTQALAEEYKTKKINAVVPKRTNTSLRRAEFPSESPDELLSPLDVAATIVNLLKQSITGFIVEVNKNNRN